MNQTKLEKAEQRENEAYLRWHQLNSEPNRFTLVEAARQNYLAAKAEVERERADDDARRNAAIKASGLPVMNADRGK